MRFKECKRILSEIILRKEFYTKTNDPYMMLHKEYTTENHNLFIIISPLSIFIENKNMILEINDEKEEIKREEEDGRRNENGQENETRKGILAVSLRALVFL